MTFTLLVGLAGVFVAGFVAGRITMPVQRGRWHRCPNCMQWCGCIESGGMCQHGCQVREHDNA